MTRNRGCRCHCRANQMRAATLALPSLKVAVAGGGAALAGGKLVAIHRQTHTASRMAPLETSLAEDVAQTLFFCLALDSGRTRNNDRHDARSYLAPFSIACSLAQILDARIGARTDKHGIGMNIGDLCTRFQVHIGQ